MCLQVLCFVRHLREVNDSDEREIKKDFFIQKGEEIHRRRRKKLMFAFEAAKKKI